MEGGVKMAIYYNSDKEEAERVLEQLYKLLVKIQIENENKEANEDLED